MAKAVTLKNSNNEEVYPVTDASLVNGTFGASQLTDGAVTPQKVKWSDMVVVAPKVSSGTTMALTIPAGTWKITGSMFFLLNQSSSTYQNIGLVIGTDDRRQNTNFLVYSSAIRGQFCVVDTATVAADTTVTLHGAGTLRYNSCALIAERIG